jgi:hypothetical protein
MSPEPEPSAELTRVRWARLWSTGPGVAVGWGTPPFSVRQGLQGLRMGRLWVEFLRPSKALRAKESK